MDYHLIGQQIRTYRKMAGLSQEELAFQIGISTTHMSHIETGRTKLSLPVLVQTADILHVSIDRLVRGDDYSKPSAFLEAFPPMSECSEREQQIAVDILNAYLSALRKHPK